MAEPKDIAKLVAIMSAAFPAWKVNEFTTEVYFEDLKDIASDELFAAAKLCRTEAGRAFAPSTGEIRGAVAEIRRQASGVPSGFEAWGDLIKAGDGWKSNSYLDETGWVIEKREYKFLHPLVKEVASMLGWPDRFPGSPDNEMADRAHFVKAYDAQIGKLMQRETMPEDVRGYIESTKTSDPIKQLTKGLAK